MAFKINPQDRFEIYFKERQAPFPSGSGEAANSGQPMVSPGGGQRRTFVAALRGCAMAAATSFAPKVICIPNTVPPSWARQAGTRNGRSAAAASTALPASGSKAGLTKSGSATWPSRQAISSLPRRATESVRGLPLRRRLRPRRHRAAAPPRNLSTSSFEPGLGAKCTKCHTKRIGTCTLGLSMRIDRLKNL